MINVSVTRINSLFKVNDASANRSDDFHIFSSNYRWKLRKCVSIFFFFKLYACCHQNCVQYYQKVAFNDKDNRLLLPVPAVLHVIVLVFIARRFMVSLHCGCCKKRKYWLAVKLSVCRKGTMNKSLFHSITVV